ncbi:MAG: NAD(P)/FAD-dependent oxidoreductase [candidate division KSB1 bacterium]|nr:NAD(P)/FAD-dependent oxidoreductase [candidate division KSB1 bacterium]MDZ7303551.1 NAD(P)/FAD-dependent oxidoreductase [candidate division KSB1 bacterium]MDZ7312794.1 NAD(P)/FAD-dependent oxidoreductase [candidate division KSB1 bacterium]
MQSEYDIIVVGAGPGGSWAAKAAAEKGAKVLVLEKDREVGIPVRCAEGVGAEGLRIACDPDPLPRGIANEISGVVLVAPDGREVVVEGLNGVGYILDRKIFDYELSLMAAAKGAEIRTKAYVYDLIRDGTNGSGAINGVRVQHLGRNYDVRAKVVIGADGVESRVGRFAGLRTFTKLKDMESCMQVTLANIKIDRRYIYLYFGHEVAPGGYLWIFPKSDTVANVGLGISGDFARHKSAQRYLQEFIARHFPTASAMYTVVGGVICSPTLKEIVCDGLMLVGDAAHQINPMSGGGIVPAMIAGRIAGRVAAEAVAAGDVSSKRLGQYPKEWHEAEGKKHERWYKIKQAVYKFTDEELNHTAAAVLAMKPEERTLINIFKTALLQHPSLIFDVVKIFMS